MVEAFLARSLRAPEKFLPYHPSIHIFGMYQLCNDLTDAGTYSVARNDPNSISQPILLRLLGSITFGIMLPAVLEDYLQNSTF